MVLAVASCVSPTLPLPPPEEPESMQAIEAEDGTFGELWQVSGTCLPGAQVTIFNTVTERGVVVLDGDGDGRYTAILPATLCDLALVSQERDDEASADTGFVVQEVASGTPVDSATCAP